MNKTKEQVLAERQKQDEAEAKYCPFRIAELRENPVQGNFDANHLKEINRRIFQDLPNKGFHQVRPGLYRPPVPNDGQSAWIKNRWLESTKSIHPIVYSLMDKYAQDKIDKVLLEANPAKLSKLSVPEFVQQMADIYANLDYLHPFDDGNSRTLREFTYQLANESGFVLSWEKFNQTQNGRDILYIARDLSVSQIALVEQQTPQAQFSATQCLDMLDNNKSLQQLLPTVIKSKHQIKLEDAVKDASLALDDFKKQQSSDINLYEKLANQASAARYDLDMFIENGYKPPAIDNPKQSATKSRGR